MSFKLLIILLFATYLQSSELQKYYLQNSIGVCAESELLGPGFTTELGIMISDKYYIAPSLGMTMTFCENKEYKFINPKINVSYYYFGLKFKRVFLNNKLNSAIGIHLLAKKEIELRDIDSPLTNKSSIYSAMIKNTPGLSTSLDYTLFQNKYSSSGLTAQINIGEFNLLYLGYFIRF